MSPIAQSVLTPFNFGAVGDASTDDTTALQAFITAGGGYLSVPSGGFYKVTSTLTVPSNCILWGISQLSIIKLVLAGGSAVIPLMVTAQGSTNVTLRDFTLDHNASALVDPATLSGNPLLGNCLLFMSAQSRISGLTVKNSWDNGIGIGSYNLSTGTGTAGAPNGVVVDGCITVNCGCGVHTLSSHLGKIGAGIDVLSAANVVVGNCVDYESYSGFGTDTGGGAQATFVNCTSWVAQMDSGHPGNGSGNAFVAQTGQTKFVGCFAFFPGAYGFWLSNGINSGCVVGCQSQGSGYHGLYINGSNVEVAGFHSQDSSQASSGSYDGICVAGTFNNIVNVNLTGCHSTNTAGTQRYGYNEIPGSFTITQGVVFGGRFEGNTKPINTSAITATSLWVPPASGVGFQVDPSSGNIALGGSLATPGLKITQPAGAIQQWIELDPGTTNQGASLTFTGTGSGNAGTIQNNQQAGFNIVTRGSVVQAQFIDNGSATSFPTIQGGGAKGFLGVAGSDTNADLALSAKGTGSVSHASPATFSLGTSLTAAGTTLGTALQLTKQFNILTTVASGTGAALPLNPKTGYEVTVKNRGANALLVYPDTSGHQIGSGSAGAAVSLAAGSDLKVTWDGTQWW